MSQPVFKLAIVDAQREIVVSTWGGEKLEVTLTEAILDKLTPTAIGIFSTRAAVETAIANAITDVCIELKRKSIYALRVGRANVIE